MHVSALLRARLFHIAALPLSGLLLALGLLACATAQVGETPEEGELPCTPQASACVDAATQRVCNLTGDAWEEVPCEAGERCAQGQCSPAGGNNPANNSPGNNASNNSANNAINSSQNNNNPGNNSPGNNSPGNNSPGNNNPGNNNPANNNPDPDPCEPFSRTCASPTLVQVCRADGSGSDFASCGAANPCEDGVCTGTGQPGTCTPDARECVDNVRLRVCRSDGSAWDTWTCPGATFCTGEACEALPGCTDGDGDGFGVGTCLGADCDDASADVHPYGLELCTDSVDSDCDGINPPCACNPVTQDCPGGERLMCSVGADNTFQCLSAGTLPAGSSCRNADELCARGTVCAGSGTDFTCQQMCDFGTGGGCPDQDICLPGFDDIIFIGICAEGERCSVTSESACGAGQKCTFLNEDYGTCIDGVGPGTEGQACDPNAQADPCGKGLLCVTFNSTPPRSECRAICDTRNSNADCANHNLRTCLSGLTITLLDDHPEFDLTNFGVCN